MTDDPTYSMAVRTGNWTRQIMLPFHQPVKLRLAPSEHDGVLVELLSGLPFLPPLLTSAELYALVVDASGRAVLDIDTRIDRREVRSSAPSDHWQLRLEGPSGYLELYPLEGASPPQETLQALLTRMTAPAARRTPA
ncbi:hypothetical protein NOCA2390077 [metagenome]|uniref:Uncharacterized protein n=1 Tax=metagenome TaxID=256318 RepID=A0A2P2C5A8_9ZZZZ